MSAAHEAAVPGLPRVGEVLDGRFELLGPLGEGGMGHVFRARDRRWGREVALKLLTPRYLGRPERELRFLRELELGRRAEQHRNLVDVLDGGRLQDLGWPFVVTELVNGRDLAGRLALGPLQAPDAARLARQVAGAVLALHRAGIVHRDVTTMNVLVADGDAVLIDLSHACEVAAPQVSPGEHGRLTRENEVPGTDHYMPPEQARAEPAQPAMDVYAFGVMLVHMLTGVAPGHCGREAFIELQREGRLRPPRIDTRVYTEVPLALAELVDACVAAEPERRPTMDEVVRRLDEQLVVMTASVETGDEVVAANEAGTMAAAARQVQPTGPERSRWTMVAAVGVVAMLAGLAGLWPGSEEKTNEATVQIEAPSEPTRVVGSERPSEPTEPAPKRALPASPPPTAAAPLVTDDPAPKPSPPPVALDADGFDDRPTTQRGIRSADRSWRTHRPKPTPAPPPEPPELEPCEEILEQATAAREGRRWSRVVQLTGSSRCWDDPTAGMRLQIKALSELGRYGDCMKLAETSSDPELKRLGSFCARQHEVEAP